MSAEREREVTFCYSFNGPAGTWEKLGPSSEFFTPNQIHTMIVYNCR
jgi:hypothetical protein